MLDRVKYVLSELGMCGQSWVCANRVIGMC